MHVQYINIESHTVKDGVNEYKFKHNDTKEVSEKLGLYLCGKYRNSFKKANAPIEKEVIKTIKDTVKKAVSYVLYTKKADSTTWKSLPVNMQLSV